MKKIRFLLPILCTLLCFTLTVSAHSGKTDSNGGHHDRIHGGYHYHRGENAGQVQNDDEEHTTQEQTITGKQSNKTTINTSKKSEEQNKKSPNQKRLRDFLNLAAE